MLEYKGPIYGCVIDAVPAPRTSQRCSACGYADAGNRTSQSEFRCLRCGHHENADDNASKSILALGQEVAGSCPETENACGADVRHLDLRIGMQSALKRESAWSMS